MRLTHFGIALGGGGARGLAHVGVMQVLEREGLRPTVFAGTSIGGLMAAFFAAGKSGAELEEIALRLNWAPLWEWRPGVGLLNFEGFEALLKKHLPETFEELAHPLVVTGTDLSAGVPVYLHSGQLYEAIRATIAFPGAIAPIWIEGRLLADGGILNQVPVDAARFLGAEKVLAVDITAPRALPLDGVHPSRWDFRRRSQQPLSSVQVAARAVELMQAHLTQLRLAMAMPDLLLSVDLPDIGLESFWKGRSAIEAGRNAAEKLLPEIRTRCALPATRAGSPAS